MVKKILAKFEVSYLQALDEEGNADQQLMPKLSEKEMLRLYEMMVLVRAFDDKAFSLQRQGRIGTYLQIKGQEAAQVGSAMALKDDDWLFPMYRSAGALIARKHPMHLILAYYGGDERSLKAPEGINNFPICIAVGTQTLHAAGSAIASSLKNEKSVSLVYLGDGATSKEDCMSAMNFAGVFKAPVIFLVENNQYAISVPRKTQTASETIAQKAIAFGFEGIQIDGNDIFGVYGAVKNAVEKARAGKGPTFIECFTYRLGDHSTSDDAARYRLREEVAEWQKKDPLLRLEKFLSNQKLLTIAKKEEILEKAKEKVEEAVEAYEAMEPPAKDDFFKFMFKEMPEQLKEQHDEFMRSHL
ncbi:pyruvate dehydrogenase (acetyl-transferring) E1 component subunit alpha [Candidatus Woesearchaeota archaeon]|nr:pyruvate dehydrogenase (acetyl-transferring) E1 component subunit alpha [Candidatus Woesearchaeota archaeon]